MCISIYLSINQSINQSIYLPSYPIYVSSCISLYLSTVYLFTHPHRSTYESIHPACQTQQSISVCLSPLFTYPFTHPHQCAYPVACACLSISIDSSPCTHAPISIRSITDCSEGWKEARHTHLLWSPEVPGLAPHRRFIDDVGGGHSLPACLPVTE